MHSQVLTRKALDRIFELPAVVELLTWTICCKTVQALLWLMWSFHMLTQSLPQPLPRAMVAVVKLNES